MKHIVLEHLMEAQDGLNHLVSNAVALETISDAARVMSGALKAGNKVMSCGNGGSMCDAMHFAEELSGRYRDDRPAYAAVAISDTSHITCTANDYGFDQVFSRFVEAHGKAGDVLVCFSTSGKSANVVRAAKAARERGVKVVSLTGKAGSELEKLCDLTICTPAGRYADRVQELHIKVVHILIDLTERHMKEGGK